MKTNLKYSTSSLLIALALIATPLLVWGERAMGSQWTQRLILPFLVEEPNRHTLIVTEGRVLPLRIEENATLSADHGPYIINSQTVVGKKATLTIEPGTTLLAQEFATLIIDGELIINGTNEKPVLFSTNEAHPDNQVWGGIIFSHESQGQVTETRIDHAAPGLSCLANSNVNASHLRIKSKSVGIYTESQTCKITKSYIQSPKHGVITNGTYFDSTANRIAAGKQDKLEIAKPN